MIAAITLAVALSVTVSADHPQNTGIPGDANLDGVVDSGDIMAARYMYLGYYNNLTVTSDGCCPITVTTGWASCGCGGGCVVAPGDTETFWNIYATETVTLSADDSHPLCTYVSWSDAGAQTHDIVMVQDQDEVRTATCAYTEAYPEPCCWCIYMSEYWDAGLLTPDGDPHSPQTSPPDYREYFGLHTIEHLDAGHGEWVYYNPLAPVPVFYTIPVPVYHQELQVYAGPEPNGYPESEWDELAPDGNGVVRTNPDPMLAGLVAFGMGYYDSMIDRINWKTRFDLWTPMTMDLTIYSWAVAAPQVLVGNVGFPYALGNAWVTTTMSSITTPTPSVTMVDDYKSIDCFANTTMPGITDIFPAGTMAYRLSQFQWADGDGVDDDGDDLIDEDPVNGYDDDGDGDTDEDGGNGIPGDEFDTMTPSGMSWVSNYYACPIVKQTFPGQLYDGYENLCLIWYCMDPPFGPWYVPEPE